jgi:hypothetical protein
MRKLIVSNFLTLDGYYESKNNTFDRFFDYFLEGYGNSEAFDVYNRDLLRGADTLILSGRTSYMANRAYRVGIPYATCKPTPAWCGRAHVPGVLSCQRQVVARPADSEIRERGTERIGAEPGDAAGSMSG